MSGLLRNNYTGCSALGDNHMILKSYELDTEIDEDFNGLLSEYNISEYKKSELSNKSLIFLPEKPNAIILESCFPEVIQEVISFIEDSEEFRPKCQAK